MAPTPRQKTSDISPIFKADKVTLAVSREKDGKLRLGYAGMDDTKVVRLRASSWGGRVESYPPRGER
jgi:hypothetical protein